MRAVVGGRGRGRRDTHEWRASGRRIWEDLARESNRRAVARDSRMGCCLLLDHRQRLHRRRRETSAARADRPAIGRQQRPLRLLLPCRCFCPSFPSGSSLSSGLALALRLLRGLLLFRSFRGSFLCFKGRLLSSRHHVSGLTASSCESVSSRLLEAVGVEKTAFGLGTCQTIPCGANVLSTMRDACGKAETRRTRARTLRERDREHRQGLD